jgi:N-acetylmuramoyl-L-alanine amidase
VQNEHGEGPLNTRRVLIVAATALLASASSASAAVPHVVQPGESLWSIAQANGLSPASLAAINGLSAGAQLRAGSVIQVASGGGVGAASASGGDGDGDSDDVGSGGGGTSAAAASPGAYTVRLGDTLSGIAARSGLSASQLAANNGLSVSAPLLAGTTLRLGGGAPPVRAASAVSTAAPAVQSSGPVPTPVRVTGPQIGSIAAQNGVPPTLARAIAWQESGFNNGAVSSANARGVMQIIPSTWSWIQHNLVAAPLSAASAYDNVKGGVLLLGRLLQDTGGNQPLAIAGYYQGLGSVRRIGMLPETRRYVANVLSLEGH